MRGKMDCFGMSDVGKVREVNEDQFLIADLNKSMLIHQTSLSHEDHTRLFGGSQGQLLLVADGMGGHSEGRRASSIAVQTIAHYALNTMTWFFRLREGDETDLNDELRAALEACQRGVQKAGNGQSRAMGTTLTLAYLLWPRLYVVHAGDSRAYLQRGAALHQITRDHTVAQRLAEQGVIQPEQVETSRWSHVLWNCIGGGTEDLNPDVYKATVQLGDSLLLCSDGLTKTVEDAEILSVLSQDLSAEQTCRWLVDLALSRGAPDNVTVVVARFRDAQHRPTEAVRVAAQEPEPAEAEAPRPAEAVVAVGG